jgi:hypothetical protein
MAAQASGRTWWVRQGRRVSAADRAAALAHVRALEAAVPAVGVEEAAARVRDTLLFKRFADEALQVASARGLPDAPVLATLLPVDALDGHLMPVAGVAGALAIVLSDRLPRFLDRLAGALAALMPPVGPQGDDWHVLEEPPHRPERLGLDAPGVSVFLDAMLEVLSGTASAGTAGTSRDLPAAAVAMRDAMGTFLVARHVAHLALGHVERATFASAEAGAQELDVLGFTGEQDEAADELGLALALATPSLKDRRPLAVWGIDALLSSFAMIEFLDAQNENENESEAFDTPADTAWGQRRAALWPNDGEVRADGEDAFALARGLAPIVAACWGHLARMALEQERH